MLDNPDRKSKMDAARPVVIAVITNECFKQDMFIF